MRTVLRYKRLRSLPSYAGGSQAASGRFGLLQVVGPMPDLVAWCFQVRERLLGSGRACSWKRLGFVFIESGA